MYKYHTHFESNNYNKRALGTTIEFLILHYTACDLITSLRILTAENSPNPTSAHYLIDEEGVVYSLVDEKYRAWHAGVSAWRGLEDINSRSIGIELVHPGYGPHYRPFSKEQMNSLIHLSQEILARHPIPPSHVLGHSDIAPLRKIDPGSLFDWPQLARQGIGFYPNFEGSELKKESLKGDLTSPDLIEDIQRLLAEYGYSLSVTGLLDTETEKVIRAFQMHFWPQQVDGQASQALKNRLEILMQSQNEIRFYPKKNFG